MELTNEFEVAVPVDVAWNVMTDLERIAPCLPGAQLRGVDGEEYLGTVKVKVGPITTSYEGAIRFLELDASEHRVVMRAEGREARGQGNATAVITATMAPSSAGTRVEIATDLAITGKVAQFGRGVLADVAAKMLDLFVSNLEATVLAPADADAAPVEGDDRGPSSPDEGTGHDDASPLAGEGTRARALHDGEAPHSAPVDVGALAGSSLARRLLKPAVVAVAAILTLRALRRRRP